MPGGAVSVCACAMLERRARVRVRPPVIFIALPIHFKGQRGDLRVRHVGIARIENFSTGHFLGARGRSLPQTLLNGVQLRIRETVAANPSGVEHAQCRERLKPLVGLCRRQRVATAAADAQQPQTRGIDPWIAGDEVRHAVDVLDAVCRLVHAARLAAAGALAGSICGDRDVALLGQVLGI